MGEKRKILLVEDDIFIKDIYQKKFSDNGFEVIACENGKKALEQLKQTIADIILLDITMPYMDGIETLAEIKKNLELCKIPIIMLTNISEKERVDEALALGANGYLIKSHFTPQEVVHKVNTLLNEQPLV